MINVLYDARFITQRRTGVGRVAEMLLRTFLSETPDLNLHVLYKKPFYKTLEGNHPICVRTPFDSHPWGDIHRNTIIRGLMKKRGIDLYFSPAFYVLQCSRNLKQVVLIHDMAVFDQPQSVNRMFRIYLRKMIGSALRNASCITTPSEFVRKSILLKRPDLENRVHAVHLGVDPVFRHYNDAHAQDVRRHYCLPTRFILCVATVEPRKNLLNLLDAYAIYSGRASRPLNLVIVGDNGYRSEEIHRRAEQSDVATGVRFLGYVPDTELALLLGMADCFVFPSLYEGFGLPVIEAMAAGCPVIASRAASIPEIAGEAALLVDPKDVLQIEKALRHMTSDAALRKKLSMEGKKRVETMTWSQTAERYRSLFQRTVECGEKENE
jgi:glycosyltransferase involved in cell wall biosynthesis